MVTAFESPTYGLSTKSSGTLTVEGGNTSVIGPFIAAAYNNDTGYCSISYTVTTSVTVAIFTVDTN